MYKSFPLSRAGPVGSRVHAGVSRYARPLLHYCGAYCTTVRLTILPEVPDPPPDLPDPLPELPDPLPELPDPPFFFFF